MMFCRSRLYDLAMLASLSERERGDDWMGKQLREIGAGTQRKPLTSPASQPKKICMAIVKEALFFTALGKGNIENSSWSSVVATGYGMEFPFPVVFRLFLVSLLFGSLDHHAFMYYHQYSLHQHVLCPGFGNGDEVVGVHLIIHGIRSKR